MHQRYFKDLPREAPYNVLMWSSKGPMISALADEGRPLGAATRSSPCFRGAALPYFILDTTEGAPA